MAFSRKQTDPAAFSEEGDLPPLSADTRANLARLGHSPVKKLGQNFLIDPNIVRKSLELGQVQRGDTIVEVGPGLGTLTRALLEEGATVYAVEKDPSLARWLRDNLCIRFKDTFKLFEGDALKYPTACLPKGIPYKIVANLPYAISTPWLEQVLSLPNLPTVMVLMLQKETADRFAAQHGTKHFSAITILLQEAYTFARGHRVSARCFHPVPKVDSFLLHLRKKAAPKTFDERQKDLLRQLFTQRRKQLGGQLRKLCPGDSLESWERELARKNLSLQSRAEDIPTDLWANLLHQIT